jgi:predicted TPR repeat methyltransferase
MSVNGSDLIEEMIHEAYSKDMYNELFDLSKKYREVDGMSFHESFEKAYYELRINEID